MGDKGTDRALYRFTLQLLTPIVTLGDKDPGIRNGTILGIGMSSRGPTCPRKGALPLLLSVDHAPQGRPSRPANGRVKTQSSGCICLIPDPISEGMHNAIILVSFWSSDTSA